MLQDKSAIIFGASSGIGAAAAEIFAREGARVMLAARRLDRLEGVRDALVAKGHEVDIVQADVVSMDQVSTAVDATVARYGRLDCAFNNAGITYLGGVGIADSTEEEVLRMVDINLIGIWRCMVTEIRVMRGHGGGSIVNTSSIGGYKSGPKLSIYPATKHGVIGLTVQAAVDHARDGIRVNCLAPGGTDTEMIDVWSEVVPGIREGVKHNPMGRMGRPEEMAEAACWMLSDRASYMNGSTVVVDGGALA